MVKPSLRDITTSNTSLRIRQAGQEFGAELVWFGSNSNSSSSSGCLRVPTCTSWFLSSEGQDCLPTGDRPLLISVLLCALSLPLVKNRLALMDTPAGVTGDTGWCRAPRLKGYLVLFLHYACTVYGGPCCDRHAKQSRCSRSVCTHLISFL